MISNEEYYEKQRTNLEYPNETYINDCRNKNKADKIRFDFAYQKMSDYGLVSQAKQVLDIGCNDGYFLRHYNFPQVKKGGKTGIDMFSMDEYTRGRYRTNPDYWTNQGEICYRTGLIEETYEQLQQKFDIVLCGEIIEHVKDVECFLEIVKSLVNPMGGAVCFTTPNSVGGSHSEHFREYSEKTLLEVLKKYFTTVHISNIDTPEGSWPFLFAICQCC